MKDEATTLCHKNLLHLQVNRYAFSGGQDSIENHRKYGANLEVCFLLSYWFTKKAADFVFFSNNICSITTEGADFNAKIDS